MNDNFYRGNAHITKEIKQNPENFIPRGPYCYSRNNKTGQKNLCPFHDIDISMPEQMNGYCHFLQLGDWEIGLENAEITIMQDGPANLIGKTAYEIFISDENIKIPMSTLSLLWDQCKECGINNDGEGDI